PHSIARTKVIGCSRLLEIETGRHGAYSYGGISARHDSSGTNLFVQIEESIRLRTFNEENENLRLWFSNYIIYGFRSCRSLLDLSYYGSERHRPANSGGKPQ